MLVRTVGRTSRSDAGIHDEETGGDSPCRHVSGALKRIPGAACDRRLATGGLSWSPRRSALRVCRRAHARLSRSASSAPMRTRTEVAALKFTAPVVCGLACPARRWTIARSALASGRPLTNARRRPCGLQGAMPACSDRRFSRVMTACGVMTRMATPPALSTGHSSGSGVGPRTAIHASTARLAPAVNAVRSLLPLPSTMIAPAP